jgi:phosphinothricin acetyltransferase
MRLVRCTYDGHAAAILEILNDAIVHTTAIYDYRPREPSAMVGWFETKEARRFPVVGALDDDGTLLGFASYGTFRTNPAYKYSVEHSVYVRNDRRRRGVGVALMRELIRCAREQQYHVMVGGIDATNASSIALHEGLGFVHSGTIKQAAFKFGRWLDLAFYTLTLETPSRPVDG